MELEDGSRSWLKAQATVGLGLGFMHVGACSIMEHGVPMRAYGSVATSKVPGFGQRCWAVEQCKALHPARDYVSLKTHSQMPCHRARRASKA